MKTMHTHTQGKRMFMFVPIAIIGLMAITALIMLLWNSLLPGIFNLPRIGYWQAMGLFVLSRILFGGFHFMRHDRRRLPSEQPESGDKFLNMTEEEKLQFKDHWRHHCGR